MLNISALAAAPFRFASGMAQAVCKMFVSIRPNRRETQSAVPFQPLSHWSRMSAALVVGTTAFLCACGGGGTDSINEQPSAQVSFKGRFVDAPVQGLSYRTSSGSGVTDSGGQFDYRVPGEDVVFSIGSLVIGRARATGEVHVYELDGTAHESAAGRNARVAQLLQSLDANRGSGQTIVIDAAVSARVNDAAALDWTGTQDGFDSTLHTLLSDLSMDTQFVSNATARLRADAYLATSLLRCPLDVPLPPPATPMTPEAYKIKLGTLSCIDLARINFYRARVLPMLDDQINAGMIMAALVEDSFSEQALQNALDVNPVLAALDSLDALADFKTAAEKRAAVEAVARMSQALLGFAKTAVQTMVVFDPPTSGQADPAKDPQVWMGLTNDVQGVVANGAACVAYVQGDAGGTAARCIGLVASSIQAFARAQALPGLKIDDAADQRVLEIGLDTLAKVFRAAGAAQEAMAAAGKPKDQLGKAAYGLASSLVQIARAGVSLAYAVEGQPEPSTGWKAVALGAVNLAVVPVLELGSKCYGGVDGVDRLTCITSIARESGKAVTSLTFAAIGSWEAVRKVGLQNEALVAKSVLEEVLWGGEAGSAALLQKYFPGESGRTLANSGRELTERIGLVKHDLRAVWSYLEWQKVVWGAVFTGQSSFNMLEALGLAQTYLQLVQASTQPDFDAPSINIASQASDPGEVRVRVVVAPGKSAIVGAQLRCSATEAQNYSPSSPLKAAVSGVTPVDFIVRFGTPGPKGLVCALYTSGAVPRFVGSRAAVLESVMPAAPTVTRLLVSPAVPVVGEMITLTAEGSNLGASGFKFSNFPPCQTVGAVAPEAIGETSMTLRCTAVRAMRLGYVGVLDAQGVPIPGIGQPLTVCPAGSGVGSDGSCKVSTIDLPATSFLRGENVALSENGHGADTLMNAPPYLSTANAAEWDFTVPTAGTYELIAEYAAALGRPVVISFNGAVKFNSALSAVTGGWLPADRQVISQGTVQLAAGATTMRVARSDVFPHIKGFKLVLISGGTSTPIDLTFDRWTIVGSDADGTSWSGSTINFESQTPQGQDFLVTGYFIWSGSGGSYGGEKFSGTLYSNGHLTLRGNQLIAPTMGIATNVTYDADVSATSRTLENGTWGGSGLVPSYAWTASASLPVLPASTFSVPARLENGVVFAVPPTASSCMVEASGTWAGSSTGNFVTGPVGIGFVTGPAWKLPTAPAYSLIARTAAGYFEVGSSRTLAVTPGGALTLLMNDATGTANYADNLGALAVAVSCR